MIDTLVTSQTRIKLLKKFFMNSSTRAHLRGLEAEFGDSTNAIRVELNRFEEAGLLVSSQESNKKLYQANEKHPLFSDIHNIILKETGIDKVIEKIIHRVGDLVCVYLTVILHMEKIVIRSNLYLLEAILMVNISEGKLNRQKKLLADQSFALLLSLGS